MTALIALRF